MAVHQHPDTPQPEVAEHWQHQGTESMTLLLPDLNETVLQQQCLASSMKAAADVH